MKYLHIVILFLLVSCTQKIVSSQLLQDIQYLSSDTLKGRKTGTAENRIAASFIANRFKELGLASYTPDYFQPFNFRTKNGETISGANVIAYVPGREKDVLVISAHYDHIGVINGLIYNGADDNASGTSGLLEMAAYFKKNKPNYTLVFAAFDAEEMGLQGSKAFVARPPVNIDRIKANLNMDMISHNDKNELYAVGTFKYPRLKEFLPQDYKSLKLLTGHDDPALGPNDWTNQSDQGSFNNLGIPFLYFGVEDHKDYHKATDEYKNINTEFFINAVEVIKQVVKRMDENYRPD